MSEYTDRLLRSEEPRAFENIGAKMRDVAAAASGAHALGGARMFIEFQSAITKGIEEYGALLRQRLGQFERQQSPLDDADFDKAIASIESLRDQAVAHYWKKAESYKGLGHVAQPIDEGRFAAVVDGAINELEGLQTSFRSHQRPEVEEWVSAAVALKILKPNFTYFTAGRTICERAHHGLIHARADVYVAGGTGPFKNFDVPMDFWWADGGDALTQNWGAGDFSTWSQGGYNRIELKAFGVKFLRADIEKLLPEQESPTGSVSVNDEDKEIVERLTPLVPSAALSYEQAIRDLADDDRVSFRGPALELREALREVLDHLAPDKDVVSSLGYVPEKDENGKDRAKPMMTQKARFILKKKNASTAAEQAVTAFEGAIARMIRAVYNLSSQATHVAQERDDVRQIRRYVVVLLHEILEA